MDTRELNPQEKAALDSLWEQYREGCSYGLNAAGTAWDTYQEELKKRDIVPTLQGYRVKCLPTLPPLAEVTLVESHKQTDNNEVVLELRLKQGQQQVNVLVKYSQLREILHRSQLREILQRVEDQQYPTIEELQRVQSFFQAHPGELQLVLNYGNAAESHIQGILAPGSQGPHPLRTPWYQVDLSPLWKLSHFRLTVMTILRSLTKGL